MAALRLLAVAFTAKRMGYVFLVGNRLLEWRVAEAAVKSPLAAAGKMQELINRLQPNVVVSERIDPETTRKGSVARALIEAAQRIAAENYVLDVLVRREWHYANKYEEAESLADFYSPIKAWLPKKRRSYQSEPHRMVTFEALALAHSVLKRPSTTLAAAMN